MYFVVYDVRFLVFFSRFFAYFVVSGVGFLVHLLCFWFFILFILSIHVCSVS